MRLKLLALSTLVLCVATLSAIPAPADPGVAFPGVGKTETAKSIQFPPNPTPAPPSPTPGSAVKLGKGQLLVLKADAPYLIDTHGTGAVKVTPRSGKPKPLILPAERVIGWPADKEDDPDFPRNQVTFTDEFLYIIEAKTSGLLNLQANPTVNKLDKDGKPIPFTPVDYVRQALIVDDGTTPIPVPPTPIPPGPQPNPNPPGPIPAPGQMTFVVVEDTLKAGPWRGAILTDSAVEAWYKQFRGTRTGLVHTLVDINDPTATPTYAKYATSATGKQLPYVYLVGSDGSTVKEFPANISSPQAFIADFDLHKGEPRAMGCILAAPKLAWTEFGTTPNTPLITRDQWPKSRKMTTYLPGVYDQDGIGQCASSSCCSVVEVAAYLRGIPYPKLSAGDLYSRVNGGRDNGSLLEDNIAEVTKNGVAPASMVSYVWDKKAPHNDAATLAARKKYRVVEAYWCPSFDAMVSAILQGYSVGTGMMWYTNFTPSPDGWLPTRGAGQAGGHALCVYGVEQKADGSWGVWLRNSWAATWGLAGDACAPESLFGGQIGGYYAVRVVTSPDAVTTSRIDFKRESILTRVDDTTPTLAW